MSAHEEDRRRHRRFGFLMLFVALVNSGCAMSNLSFAKDSRIDIAAPHSNETVRLPFEVRWTAEDFDGQFVVFFDQAPIRPNRPLLSLVPEDDSCRAERSCPTADWLRDRNIYVTKGTSILVESLPEQRTTSRAKDHHDLTIVLLDKEGRRLGESAFIREFVVERED